MKGEGGGVELFNEVDESTPPPPPTTRPTGGHTLHASSVIENTLKMSLRRTRLREMQVSPLMSTFAVSDMRGEEMRGFGEGRLKGARVPSKNTPTCHCCWRFPVPQPVVNSFANMRVVVVLLLLGSGDADADAGASV